VTTVTQKGRILQLDVLRGVAILLVLCGHMVVWRDNAGWAAPLARVLQTGGWTGVDLFFVLSGFLIGGLLFREIRRDGSLKAGRFLVRRAFKIWPAYFVFLAFIIGRSVRHAPTAWAGIRPLMPNLVHLQNYLGTSESTPWAHTWSLAVEEHFYLALPLLLLVLCRTGRVAWVPPVTLFVALACLGMRLALWNTPYTFLTHYMPTHLRVDSLMFGVLLAYAANLRPNLLAFVPRYRPALIAIGVVLIAPSFWWSMGDRFVFTFGYTLNYLGYGCILIACADAETGLLGRLMTGAAARVVGFIGFFSYSIYLWHWEAREQILYRFHSIHRHGATAFFALTATDVVLATALGVISAKLVEQPFLMFRDRLFPSRATAVPVPQATFETAAPGESSSVAEHAATQVG
jgi:peptidoglycan/LPS O-acetylase OafA/YrhL